MENARTLPGSCRWTDEMNTRREPDGKWSAHKARFFDDELSYLCSGGGSILRRLVAKKKKKLDMFLKSRKYFK